VRILERRQGEPALQRALPRGTVEQVGAAHDVRDALGVIVDDHCELVGIHAIAPPHDHVAESGERVFAMALPGVLPGLDRGVIDAQAQRGGAGAGRALAAGAGVGGFVAGRLELAA
jgi:hypothetical protein